MPVDIQAILFAHLVQIVYPLAVFIEIRGVNAHDGVQTFTAAVYQTGDRQFQLAQDSVLPVNVGGIRFHQSVSVLRHILVLYAFPIQRVKTDPRAGFRFAVTQHTANISPAVLQRFHQLAGCSVTASFGGEIPYLSVILFFVALGHIADIFGCFKQRFQIGNQLLHRIPVSRDDHILALQPVVVDNDKVIPAADLVVPSQLVAGAFRCPSVILGHLHNRAAGYRCSCSGKRIPFLFTFTGMIPPTVALAPRVPVDGCISFLF